MDNINMWKRVPGSLNGRIADTDQDILVGSGSGVLSSSCAYPTSF